jgi:uncharacterized protein (TIGR02301 family)
MRLAFAALAAFIGAPISAAAQTPIPQQQRRAYLDAASTLGEAHGLRHVCDSKDQTWRSRMQEILGREDRGTLFRKDLSTGFNDTYRIVEARYPQCTAEVRSAADAAVLKASAQLKRLSVSN